MTFRIACAVSIVVAALLGAGAPLAQTPAATDTATSADARDIEALVATLEDDKARAGLVRDLKLLLKAQDDAAGAGEGAPESVLEVVGTTIEKAWQSLLSIDPRKVVIASLLSLAILLAALGVRWLVLRLLQRLYARITGGHEHAAAQDGAPAAVQDHGDEAAAETRMPPMLSRLVSLIIATLALVLIAESWGAGLADILRTDFGARFAQAALSVGLILLITVALWHASRVIVRRTLTFGARHMDTERTARRLSSLVPLLQHVLQGIIGVLSALLILSELGVNIGPLLAGAGILGLAVGFGAQTLVKDLITGVIILLEDGASVGDVIEVGGHTGKVEEMRIRSLQLRDVSGAVHLVPYSEVTTIKNYTKDFSYYLMDVGVAYREDTDEVCKILRAVDEDLRGDPAFAAEIMEPLEILGVNEFADSAVVIRARLKTRPGTQWTCGREFNRRMKKRFDAAGIEIPFPHTTVYFGELKDGTAPPLQVRGLEQQSG